MTYYASGDFRAICNLVKVFIFFFFTNLKVYVYVNYLLNLTQNRLWTLWLWQREGKQAFHL